MHQFSTSVAIKVLLLMALSAGAWAEEPTMRLRLKDSGFGVGRIVPSELPNTLGWHSPGFETPFHFDIRALQSITLLASEQQFAAAEAAVPAQGQCFELSDGAMVVGHLRAMDEQWITIESDLLGEIQVARERVMSLIDAGYAGELVYSGPRNDRSWKPGKQIGKDENWEFEAGAWVAQRPGASIVGDVGLPSKSQMTIALSWKGAPDFVLSLGTSSTADTDNPTVSVPAAARIEVWDRQLALLREVDDMADIELLAELSPSNPRVELTIYLDQEEGTVIVCDGHGRPLDRMTLPPKEKSVRTAVHLVNSGVSLTLERFEVRAWDGLTTLGSLGTGVVLGESEEPLSAAIVGYSSETEELILRNADGEQLQIPISRVRRGDFERNSSDSAPAPSDARAVPPIVSQPPPIGVQPKESEPTAAGAEPQEPQEPQERQEPQEPVPAADTRASLALEGTTLFGSFDPPVETPTGDAEEPTLVEVVWSDRTRLKGVWLPSKGGRLQFEAQGLAKPFSFDADQLRGLIGSEERFVVDLTRYKNGTIKVGDTQLAGYLEQSTPEGSTSAMHWHPHGSQTSSGISDSAEGAIIYRKSLPKVKVQRATNARPDVVARPLVQLFLGGRQALQEPQAQTESQSPDTQRPTASTQRELVFRSGDTIDGTVKRVDESGLTFESSETQTSFATHEQMQSVWLNRQRREADVSPEKLERLMTVPRSMKLDPPTHLFISVLGDFLRGRLVSIDDEKVTVEVRLETVELPRDQVARIVWLHDRDWSNEKTAPPEDAGDGNVGDGNVGDGSASGEEPAPASDLGRPFYVHTIRASDRGLTFQPVRLVDGVLRGTSDVLGECAVEIADLNQVLFGRNIGAQIREFREDPWTLSLAQYPRVYLEGEGGPGAQVGSNSPLVGELAPDFGLQTLDGETFRLSKSQDRVVVLDFWASWCGPCVQTMPLVEEVVAEIGEDRVHLVAVNIQEAPTRVRAAVDRLELGATVLLDRDGEVAAAYAANAIPQTVIIDKQGRVTHVFVGGGTRFVASFREALNSMVGVP